MNWKNDRKLVIKRILSLFKPFTKQIILILLCTIVSLGVSMVLPLLSRLLIDDGLQSKNFDLVLKIAVLAFSMVLLQQLINIVESAFRAHINAHMSYNLESKVFKHLLKQKIDFFNNANSAEIVNNIDIDVSNICMVSDRSTFYILTESFSVIGGIIGLIFIDWKLTILVILMIPFRYFIINKLAKKRLAIFDKLIGYRSDYSAWYGDTLGGIKEIKLWGLDRIKVGQFVAKQRELMKSKIKNIYMDSLNEFSESVMMQFITNSLYILGGYMIFQSTLTIGGLFAFITYSAYVTGPVFSILNIGYNFSGIVPSARRLFSFLDSEVENEFGSKTTVNKNEIQGNIKFQNVTFSYSNDKNILNELNININSGEKVAIIGPNGSGKSSIVNLLLRLYEPDTGRILLDGIDIKDIHLKKYRSMISVVSQDVYLFDTTIKENISLTCQTPEEVIIKAADHSGAGKFIYKLQEKYNQPIGRNGTKLSGGERQKIAVARAFARDAKIIILDEATSNYDIDSEILLSKELRENYSDRTVILVTHKPEILEAVDRVIIIERGSVSDEGSHEELYKRNPSYRKMIENGEINKKAI